MESLYDILGINNNATPEEIKSAYREISKSNHPDKGGQASRQAQINEAYEVLSDPAKRKRYDETGQSRDVSADRKMQEFLSSTFLQVIETSKNLDRENLIDVMCAGVNALIDDANKSMREMHKRSDKMKKVLKRLKTKGDNSLLVLLERQIDGIKQDIAATEEHREFLRHVIVVMKDYDYEVDTQAEYPAWLGLGPMPYDLTS